MQRSFFFEQRERSKRRRTSNRVARVRMSVKEVSEIARRTQECVVHARARKGRRKRERSARDAFTERQQIRFEGKLLEGKHGPGPAEARRDLVDDDERDDLPQARVARCGNDAHPGRRLHERLDDDGGNVTVEGGRIVVRTRLKRDACKRHLKRSTSETLIAPIVSP